MKMKITSLRRLASYLAPIRLRTAATEHNPKLELLLYRGDLQLSTGDALYSDGRRYRPLVSAFKKLDAKIRSIQSVLMLGVGLSSGLHILAQKNIFPNATLVDNDSVVLDWAKEFLPEQFTDRVDAVTGDARKFVEGHTGKYDLVIVDVFDGQKPLPFVISQGFLQNCRNVLNENGNLILNYIVQSSLEDEEIKYSIQRVFPYNIAISFDKNRVFVI